MRKRFHRTRNCIVLCALLLAGCGSVSELSFDTLQVGSEGEELTTLGMSPEFDYEVPESLPSVLVDQAGYARKSDKEALFRGSVLPDTFTVVNAKSGQTVFTGKIKQRETSQESDVQISYGDFTALEASGTYYIQAAMVPPTNTFISVRPEPG